MLAPQPGLSLGSPWPWVVQLQANKATSWGLHCCVGGDTDGRDAVRGHEQVTGVGHAEISIAAKCFVLSNKALGGMGRCFFW